MILKKCLSLLCEIGKNSFLYTAYTIRIYIYNVEVGILKSTRMILRTSV